MRILQIVPRFPYPPMDGGQVGVFNLTKCLSRLGHDVLLFSLSNSAKDRAYLDDLRGLCNVRLAYLDTRSSLRGAALNLLRREPYNVSKYWSRRVEDELKQVAITFRPDIVHCDHLHMARYCIALKRLLRLPIVLREHNIETIILERLAQQGSGLRRNYFSLQAKRLRRYESQVAEFFDMVVTISEEDDARLKQMAPQARSMVVPAGVDVSWYVPNPSVSDENTLVQVASMEWLPNVQGMKWFLINVLPLIREQVPAVTVKIIGKIPPRIRSEFHAFPDVFATGFLIDPRDEVCKASVYIVPLLVGGGVRIKLLEAFAMGKAVVSTSVGAEGLRVKHGEHLLIADSPKDFADSVTHLLRSRSKRVQLGANARRLVEANYSWEACGRALEEVYRQAIRNCSP